MQSTRYVVIGAALVTSGLFVHAYTAHTLVPPGPATKSTFITAFDPAGVIQAICAAQSTSVSSGNQAGNLDPLRLQNVRHRIGYRWWFQKAPRSWTPLLDGLLQCTRRELARTGAVTDERLDLDGFTIHYRVGRSRGTVRGGTQADPRRPLFVEVEEEWLVDRHSSED
jgi:hypothetical protein